MIWEYYASLRRQTARAAQTIERYEPQETSLAVILAITVVEIFFNLYFRVIVSEPAFWEHENKLVKELNGRIPLEQKLRKWPKRILGEDLDFNSEQVKAFIDLKELRNSLVHFVSTHTSIELPGSITIKGLADTSIYSSLTAEIAISCPEVVRGFAYEVFRVHGIDALKREHAFHAWFGELPMSQNASRAPGGGTLCHTSVI